MVEFSQARRAGFQPKVTSSPKSQLTSKSNAHLHPPSTPPIGTPAPISHESLLTKVDIDTMSAAKNVSQLSSIEKTSEHLNRTLKSVSTESPEGTFKMNQTLLKTISSDINLKTPEQKQENEERKDDLAFSITDITD